MFGAAVAEAQGNIDMPPRDEYEYMQMMARPRNTEPLEPIMDETESNPPMMQLANGGFVVTDENNQPEQRHHSMLQDSNQISKTYS